MCCLHGALSSCRIGKPSIIIGFCGGVDSDSGDGGDLLTSTIPLTASGMCFIIVYTIRIDSFSYFFPKSWVDRLS